MSIETIIAIIGFAISVASFVPLLVLKDRRREVVVIALATIICVVTAWHAFDWYRYDRELGYIRSTLMTELGRRAMSFEDIRHQFGDVEVPVISDAIHRMLRANEINEEVVSVNRNGQSFDIRIYRPARIVIQ